MTLPLRCTNRQGGTKLGLLLLTLALAVASCGSSSVALDPEVADRFDTNSRLVDLSEGLGNEEVRQDVLLSTISNADALGAELRIVVAAPDSEFVSAGSIVDRYGGTALAYQADRTTFEAASSEISDEQRDRAVNMARLELDIGDSAAAFVSVLEAEGLESAGGSGPGGLLLLVLLAACVFMFWGAWTYFQARKRRVKRQDTFADRKRVLGDWASQLKPEVDSLRADVVASGDEDAKVTWHEANEFVQSVVPTVERARTSAELDAAEMRISRVAIKLRNLRSSVNPGS